jgi:ribonuclease Y
MVKLLGRLLYRTSYGQNVLMHSKEVGYLTGSWPPSSGLNEQIARRAGLFHDIGKAIDYEREGTHPRSAPKWRPGAARTGKSSTP